MDSLKRIARHNNQLRFIAVTYYVLRNYGAHGGVPL